MRKANAREELEDETWEPPPEDVEQDMIDLIIPHAFLPPRLPNSIQGSLHSVELSMLQLANETFSSLSANFTQLNNLAKMLKLWESIELASKSPADFEERFTTDIVQLIPGESVAYYIRNQDTGILFTNLDNDHTRVETFLCAFRPSVIMSNANPLLVTFPHTTDVIVNKGVLHSKMFAKHLHELATTALEHSNPKSSEADENNSSSPSTVTDPFLVTDWIVGLLVPVKLDINSSQEVHCFTKKIRDDVMISNLPTEQPQPTIPFRRSAIWTALKVATQLKIFQMFPVQRKAIVIYKMIMLHMLTTICGQYKSNDNVIWSVMLAKLGRRTEKLRRIQISIEENWMMDLLQYTMNLVDATVSSINYRMGELWKSECDNVMKIPPILQRQVEHSSSLVHKFPKLDNHMVTQMPSASTSVTPERLLQKPPSDLKLSYNLKRFATLDLLISSEKENKTDKHTTRRLWIYDAECCIKSLEASDVDVTSSQVYKLFTKYNTISLKFYSVHDPVGMSQVVLSTLKMVQILDKIATTNYPLLLDYATGIIQSAFDKLLLPFRDDMKLLEKLLKYFKNRDDKSSFPSRFSSSEVTKRDFEVCYASENQLMMDLRQRILVETEVAINNKFSEVTIAKKECEVLQKKIQSLNCECRKENRWCSELKRYLKYKLSFCTKCDLETELRRKRYSVDLYERPLPPDRDKQWAVVYELMIPYDLAQLRDAVAFLNYCLLDMVVPTPSTKVTWKTYSNLAPHDNKIKCKFYNLKSVVNSTKTVNNTNKKKDLLLLSQNEFILNNGMDCVYVHSCVAIYESFKFKISNTSNPDREMYMPLQYALEEENTNQNQVIAESYNCHKEMSLAEFQSFGLVRNGHRIQLRNLYKYISDSSLALEKEPVLQIIMQIIWEIGANENGKRIRHFELIENDTFTQSFLKILNDVVDKNEANYDNVLTLLSVVVITTRIVELNATAVSAALCLLRKCRSVLDKWVTRINENVINQETSQLKLLEISICSAFTFNLSPTINPHLETPDLVHWLHTTIRLHQLINQDKCQMSASPYIQSLVSTSLNVVLKMEQKILPTLPTLLQTLAASQCNNLTWRKLEDTKSCHFAIYVEQNKAGMRHLLTFDYLQGIFLVDGYPQSSLPVDIRNNPLYKTYFKTANLKVQRDQNGFKTVAPLDSNHYEFLVQSDQVRIKEVHDTFSYELLDPDLFEKNIPQSFIYNYTHWLHSDNQKVTFRRKPKTNDDCKKPVEFTLVAGLENGSWNFESVQNKCILSTGSNGFRLVSKALKFIDGKGSINVMKDKTTNEITAHLPRYGLNFILKSGILQSVEYPDFQISHDQNLHTLIGLDRYLLLQNKSVISKQKLIIPHGNIKVSRKGSNHQDTNIDIKSLHNPPYFMYDIDPVLRRLKAQNNKEAWLYLAALHGATSSTLPDPFTGLTGTEMAVWILQSALVWSSTPYDENCLRILTTIRNFSPKRSIRWPNKRQREEIGDAIWPEGLNDMAAYDGYTLIVKKLIDDSNSLASLNEREKVDLEEENVNENLSFKAYLRNRNFYNQCAGLNPLYFPEAYQQNENVVDTLEFRNPRDEYDIKSLNRFSRYLLEANTRKASCSLKPFLITQDSLGYGNKIESLQKFTLADFFLFDFRANWLELYSFAISPQSKCNQDERQAWNVFFAAMSYKREEIEQLMNLYLIVKYADSVQFPLAPATCYPTPADNTYSDERMESRLQKEATKYPVFLDWVQIHFPEQWLDYSDSSRNSEKHEDLVHLNNNCKTAFETAKNQFGRDCENYIRNTVRCLNLHSQSVDALKIKPSEFFTSVAKVVDVINSELKLISQCQKLLEFVENVEGILTRVKFHCSLRYDEENRKVAKRHSYKQLTPITLEITTKPEQPFQISAEELFNTANPHIIPVWSPIVYGLGKITFKELTEPCFEMQNFISEVFTDDFKKRILNTTGISPRIVPTILLQYLRMSDNPYPSEFTTAVGALAVLWTHLQRQNRIQVLKGVADATSVEQELEREQQNLGYKDWNPIDHPEWVLLQLELDMMIRPIQIEVARRMKDMPIGKNGVMQLNMGEGKTSVIIPMLCATLASCASLVRVTVLKSIFATNLKILTFAIGGLLNQRVYTFPCRRDLHINQEIVKTIKNGLETCLASRGVILTLPEHTLSFRLKKFDEINKGNVKLALKMKETEDWLGKYVRDLLDESDELLSVKYQLVYTVGTQVPVDGNDLRWKTCQQLLELVQELAPDMSTKYGSSVVELERNNHPEQFDHFRFLSESFKSDFYNQLADKVLANMMLSTADKNTVKSFITQENPPIEIHNRIADIANGSKDFFNKIFLLAGFIGRGILHLALTKRWRVEYGVDPKGHRLMAVPFRAKDVATEKTEFGHSDLAIVLTHLSYYYGGLSDDEMSRIFACLKTKNAPEMMYSFWIHKILQVPRSLTSYQGINLKDSYQRRCVYDLLRKHKSVIDFYLSEKVFPKECKQFPGKMSMSAWDLVHEKNCLPISGFSGTNDSNVLLPSGIIQQDMEKLSQTNLRLEQTLLRPINYGHRGLRLGVPCKEILENLKGDGVRVLIDAGALMLELDNEQVASRWLKIDCKLEATVYFDRQHEIMVKTRTRNEDMRLEFSPYRNRLGACGVYLDDQHTRATDLNFPTGSRACVTVGTRMKRDKLMQACMRMRKLRNGHSVVFYLSHEVHHKVKSISNNSLQTSDIITWVCDNTKKFNEDGLVHWAMAGRNYAQKLAAEKLFEQDLKTAEAAKIMGKQVVDQEATLLEKLYGVTTKSELLVDVVPKLFDAIKEKLELDNNGIPLRQEVEVWLKDFCTSVVYRCKTYVPEKTHVWSDLEEVQEKELETEGEIEEERQVCRPPKAEHVKPSVNKNLWRVLQTGQLNANVDWIVKISEVFSNVSFSTEVQPDGWGTSVYATKDFASVIKTNKGICTNLYLRPVEYVAVRVDPISKTVQMLVLSPFEVNKLVKSFREKSPAFTLHMYSMRRTENQDNLINNSDLQVPSRGNKVEETDPALACLQVAAGNLYFGSNSEAKACAGFLGLVPKPWTDDQQSAFENGWITKTGFMLPHKIITKQKKNQRRMIGINDEISSEFGCDPVSLVKRILACRHRENVNEVAHVIKLLEFLDLPFTS